jgi:Tol biopolymer transport system component
MRWLSDQTLLCLRKEKHWIADLENVSNVSLDFIEDYLMIDVAPDGNRLLLKRGIGIGGGVYVGDLEQRQVQEIVRDKDYDISHLILRPCAWSPDGHTIACVGGYEDQVWLVDADGTNPRKAADGDYFWFEAHWSPDNHHMAVVRSLDGGGPSSELGGVFVVDLDSGEEKLAFKLRRDELLVV